jgi:hypothetical protein
MRKAPAPDAQEPGLFSFPGQRFAFFTRPLILVAKYIVAVGYNVVVNITYL